MWPMLGHASRHMAEEKDVSIKQHNRHKKQQQNIETPHLEVYHQEVGCVD